MRWKYEYGEGPLYTIANYICWFFIGNLYFWILNIPLVLVILMTIIEGNTAQNHYILFLVCSIPIGPSLTALCGVMGKITRENDANFTKDFFKSYKNGFVQSIIIWSSELALFFIFYVDIKFFKNAYKLSFASYLFLSLSIIILVCDLYIFPIISRFYMRIPDILKLSIYYMVKNFNITVINVSMIALAVFILYKVPLISMIFIISITSYVIMFFEKNVLKEIENSLKTP